VHRDRPRGVLQDVIEGRRTPTEAATQVVNLHNREVLTDQTQSATELRAARGSGRNGPIFVRREQRRGAQLGSRRHDQGVRHTKTHIPSPKRRGPFGDLQVDGHDLVHDLVE
jgi:hypothetical protein